MNGRYLLKRGVDPAKDQSYFLFTLTQDQLSHAMFPVGALDKPAVRALARELDLAVSDKPDSHEICFVADGDHNAFLESHGAVRAPGAIRDTAGRVVGTHDGVHRFTVGQRKGLGLSSGVRLYVVDIDASEGAVTVGPREALERSALTASGVNWIAGTPPAAGHARHGADPSPPSRGRGHHPSAGRTTACQWSSTSRSTRSRQDRRSFSTTGTMVLGGGWID